MAPRNKLNIYNSNNTSRWADNTDYKKSFGTVFLCIVQYSLSAVTL